MTGFLTIQVGVFDFYRARNAIVMANNGNTYRGIFKDAISEVLNRGAQYARDIVHRDTGHLMEAIDWKYDSHRMVGEIFISDRTAWNTSKSVRREPQKYAVFEENRGADHAFMLRTMRSYVRPHAISGIYNELVRTRWP